MTKLNQFLLYDELPFWSAPFGMALLDVVQYKRNLQVVDIGSGSGFPMLELAERLGGGSMVTGIDPSEDACGLIREKIRLKEIGNAGVIRTAAEEIPLGDQTIDLVTGNNGLNNVADIGKVLKECIRICKPGAQLVFTMNLPHTLTEFYDELRIVLQESGLQDYIPAVEEHIARKRKPVEYWRDMFLSAGFSIRSIQVDGFRYRFADSEALFRHYFFRTAFRPSWEEILPAGSTGQIFQATGRRLEEIIAREGSLGMSVPFACFDLNKPQI